MKHIFIENSNRIIDSDFTIVQINNLCKNIHSLNEKWWFDLKTGEALQVNVGEKLMLMVSELAEAMEGHRKNLNDDKLTHRKMLDVELADTVIRIFDFCGRFNIDLGSAIIEKLQYNQNREDHKIENRLKENGKKY